MSETAYESDAGLTILGICIVDLSKEPSIERCDEELLRLYIPTRKRMTLESVSHASTLATLLAFHVDQYVRDDKTQGRGSGEKRRNPRLILRMRTPDYSALVPLDYTYVLCTHPSTPCSPRANPPSTARRSRLASRRPSSRPPHTLSILPLLVVRDYHPHQQAPVRF